MTGTLAKPCGVRVVRWPGRRRSVSFRVPTKGNGEAPGWEASPFSGSGGVRRACAAPFPDASGAD